MITIYCAHIFKGGNRVLQARFPKFCFLPGEWPADKFNCFLN